VRTKPFLFMRAVVATTGVLIRLAVRSRAALANATPFARLPAITLVVIIAMSACGDDHESISKADYVRQVNELCEEAIAEVVVAMRGLGGEPSADEVREVAFPLLVELNRDFIDFFEKGPWPEGDAAVLQVIVEESKTATDELEDQMSEWDGDEVLADPYVEVNAKIDAYGMTSCTG
jgi:hypothetical protein